MLVWKSMHVSSTAHRSSLTWPGCCSSSAGPRLGRNLLATDLSASAGYTLNQSMVVQLTSDGNLLGVTAQMLGSGWADGQGYTNTGWWADS